MSDKDIEQAIQAKGLTAPRVTPADIEAEIASEHYFTAEEGVQGALAKTNPDLGVEVDSLKLLTFCVLTLRNGFTVTGESACASPENFDAEIGRQIARQNAVAKVWPLLGFRLRDQLARPALTDADAAADLAGTPRPDYHGDVVQRAAEDYQADPCPIKAYQEAMAASEKAYKKANDLTSATDAAWKESDAANREAAAAKEAMLRFIEAGGA